MTAASWTSLRKIETGHVFTRSTPSLFDRWEFICNAVCHEFECDENDLDLSEDDEGNSVVTLKGEPVVEVVHGYAKSIQPVQPSYSMAAE